MVSKKKNELFVWGWDRKIHPHNHGLSSLNKPYDAKQRSSWQIFLSHPYTYIIQPNKRICSYVLKLSTFQVQSSDVIS